MHVAWQMHKLNKNGNQFNRNYYTYDNRSMCISWIHKRFFKNGTIPCSIYCSYDTC